MSFLDRLAAAVTPAASDEQRAEARREVERIGAREPFVRDIVEQHKQIESLFAEARNSTGEVSQAAVRELATLLTGHSMAEEAIIYPDIASYSSKTQAGMAYEEHAMTKIQLAELQKLEPQSKEWREKLDHVESAVQQHVYQEEGSWLPDLVDNAPLGVRQTMSERYREEFERYWGSSQTESNHAAGREVA